jgi:lipoprotein
MTTKRTPTPPKKPTAVRILRRIGVIVGIIAACLFLLYAALIGYERISQYIVYKEAEQLLNDPMGRKDLLEMNFKYTTVSPRTNVGLFRMKPRPDYSITNFFEIDSTKQEDKLRKDLESTVKDGGWAITESDVVTDSLYTIEATKSQNNKSLRLTIYIDKDTPGKLSIIITVRCSGVEL